MKVPAKEAGADNTIVKATNRMELKRVFIVVKAKGLELKLYTGCLAEGFLFVKKFGKNLLLQNILLNYFCFSGRYVSLTQLE